MSSTVTSVTEAFGHHDIEGHVILEELPQLEVEIMVGLDPEKFSVDADGNLTGPSGETLSTDDLATTVSTAQIPRSGFCENDFFCSEAESCECSDCATATRCLSVKCSTISDTEAPRAIRTLKKIQKQLVRSAKLASKGKKDSVAREKVKTKLAKTLRLLSKLKRTGAAVNETHPQSLKAIKKRVRKASKRPSLKKLEEASALLGEILETCS